MKEKNQHPVFSSFKSLGNKLPSVFYRCVSHSVWSKVVAPWVSPHIAVGPKLHPKSFLSQRTPLRLTPSCHTHLSHGRNKFDNVNLIPTWPPSPPHTWSYSVPPEIKDGHHPTSPSDLDMLHRDLWAMEQLCHRELPNLTLGHWESWQGDKTHLPHTDTSQSAAPLTALTAVLPCSRNWVLPAPQGQDGDKGQGCSGCPVSPTWPIQHGAARAAPGTQTQLHRPHHSHCPKAQHQQCHFCCQYQLESAIDDVPEQVSNV